MACEAFCQIIILTQTGNCKLMELCAKAKINLSLDVTGKRPDGYHLVRMVMQSLDLSDTLIIEKRETPGIELSCSRDDIPSDQRNLCWKAAELLMKEYGISGGVRIDLHKAIPSAAGLAGGSSDAAAVLKGVNEIYGLGIDQAGLLELGVRIGADVPYCLTGGTALAEGIGEKLTLLPAMPDCTVLLAKPSVGISTGAVYQKLDSLAGYSHPDIDAQVRAIREGSLSGIISACGNVLEAVTAPEHPVIEDIERCMMECGAAVSRMSGSGPTVFGIFTDSCKAEHCQEVLRESGFDGDIFVTCPSDRED